MSARDELAKVIYAYTPLMTVIQDAHKIADAAIAAGWKSPDEVAETREKFARTVTALNGRFQESVTEVVRAAKEAAWNEGSQAVGDSWFDGEPGVVKNPYSRSETP